MITLEQLAEIVYDAARNTQLNLVQATIEVVNKSGAAMNQAFFCDVQDQIRKYRESHKNLEVHSREVHKLLFAGVSSEPHMVVEYRPVEAVINLETDDEEEEQEEEETDPYADLDLNDTDDCRRIALCEFLGEEIDNIEMEYGQTVSCGRAEYLVVTDDEAEALWDDALDSYIDDCLEIPEHIVPYFDRDAWKRDARYDGRGHSLASYDGDENETEVNGTTFYIYRTN